MTVADQRIYQQHREKPTAVSEVLLVALVFASMGAITWAIRGTSGWGGIDGTIVPGMMWGVLWWYICWRKGIDARGIPLWLGLGIALGGELGYGQYVSWIRGMFSVRNEVVPVAPWIGYVWFAICGIGWAAPGGIALGWALAGRKSLGVWLSRLVIPMGAAFLTRLAVQTWPGVFFPNWNLHLYVVESGDASVSTAAANTQWHMIVGWLAIAFLSLIAWRFSKKDFQPVWLGRGMLFCAVGGVITVWLPVAQWLFFPNDQLDLFAGKLGQHLDRTVYTNSQNVIVVGWWIGAILVAAIGRDRYTLCAGLVLGLGFGLGFPLAALWCLGYGYASKLVDWWKMWELNAGFYLGLLYVVVLYWAIRQVKENREASQNDNSCTDRKWCRTIPMASAAFLIVYVMARENFLTIGMVLGSIYVVALFLATIFKDQVAERRQAVSFIYSVFLLVFIMTWGVSAQAGILLGLYEADAVDQYAWPPARIAIFVPAGILITAAAWLAVRQVLRNPRVGLPARAKAPRIHARIVDLITFTGVVGAASIWPSKIGVLYALLIGIALFAFNRLNRCFESLDAS